MAEYCQLSTREHLIRIQICLRFSKQCKISGDEKDFWQGNNLNNNRLYFIENKCVNIKIKQEEKNKPRKPQSIFLLAYLILFRTFLLKFFSRFRSL